MNGYPDRHPAPTPCAVVTSHVGYPPNDCLPSATSFLHTVHTILVALPPPPTPLVSPAAGEIATAAFGFDVVTFCSSAWSWAAGYGERMGLLQSSQVSPTEEMRGAGGGEEEGEGGREEGGREEGGSGGRREVGGA